MFGVSFDRFEGAWELIFLGANIKGTPLTPTRQQLTEPGPATRVLSILRSEDS